MSSNIVVKIRFKKHDEKEVDLLGECSVSQLCSSSPWITLRVNEFDREISKNREVPISKAEIVEIMVYGKNLYFSYDKVSLSPFALIDNSDLIRQTG
ncbi:MAG: hypothetical protein GF311_23700 [Candidatus Lokiarchaeota archaeon]|nr:hypothetical protein [Candidatus Lokiarchaeota archaeon]